MSKQSDLRIPLGTGAGVFYAIRETVYLVVLLNEFRLMYDSASAVFFDICGRSGYYHVIMSRNEITRDFKRYLPDISEIALAFRRDSIWVLIKSLSSRAASTSIPCWIKTSSM